MKKLVLLFVVLIAVIALFAYMTTAKLGTLFTVSHSSHKISPTPQVFATKVIPVIIHHGKVVNGKNIQVAKGQMVVLQIRSDTDDTLEVLGYNKDVFLHKGQMVVLSFLSTLAGDFAYKLQNGKAVLGTISVGD